MNPERMAKMEGLVLLALQLLSLTISLADASHVLQDRQDLAGLLENRDLLDHLVFLVTADHQVLLARLERWDLLATKDSQALLDAQDHQDRLERLVRSTPQVCRVTLDLLEHVVHLENRASLEHLEPTENPDRQVDQGTLERTVTPDETVLLVRLVTQFYSTC